MGARGSRRHDRQLACRRWQAASPIARARSFFTTPTLFFEFTGSEHNVTEQVTQVKDICAEFGVTQFDWAVGY